MRKKVWIDTDIGTDIDDLLALIYALKNPAIEVVGVSTSQGNAIRRAQIASKVVDLLGKDTKVYVGEDNSKKYWIGYEGEGIANSQCAPAKAVRGVLESIISDPQITIACIAPMTDLALALIKNPALKAEVYIMGQQDSHNFKADIIASEQVMKYKDKITLITRDVCKKTYLTIDELFSLRTGNKELDKAIYANAKNWNKYSPYKDRFYLYDPLTIAAIAKPELIKFGSMYGYRASVDVDAEAFKKHFLEVICND